MPLAVAGIEVHEDRIALEPVQPRDAARMLVCRLAIDAGAHLEDRTCRELPDLLAPGDALVLNDTRVIHAMLAGRRARGDVISVRLVKRIDESCWRAITSAPVEAGERIRFGLDGKVCLLGVLDATVAAVEAGNCVDFEFSLHSAYLDQAIEDLGSIALPAEIAARREPSDADKVACQAVFARVEGAVKLQSAGLHVTMEMLAVLEARGISRHFATLHLAAGAPDSTSAGGAFEPEHCEVSAVTAAALAAARKRGGRIVAVGASTLRLLEAAADADGIVRAFAGKAAVQLGAGYNCRAADGLLTSLHVPPSTQIGPARAFADDATIRVAYAHAAESGYRFGPFGDVLLLLRD